MKYKGILLAGGDGTRLNPITLAVSKQLLPIYDKPMIYYPLSTLMLAGIKDILLISSPRDISRFQRLLGTGNQWGLTIEYAIQFHPAGLPEAFILGESFIGEDNVALILGDNIFYGHDFRQLLIESLQQKKGATIFAYHVDNPKQYGVVEFDDFGHVLSLEEKPQYPRSNYAVTGLYFYDNQVVELSKRLKPSFRGELEITDLNQLYLDNNQLKVRIIGRGHTWLDAGTYESLLEAGLFVSTMQHRQGLKLACLEEIAYRQGWIDEEQLEVLLKPLIKNSYGRYLENILEDRVF